VLWYAGNQQVAAAIAFSLALFSHVLNHTIMRLQSALYDVEHPQPPLPTVPSSGHNIFIISIKDYHHRQFCHLTTVTQNSNMTFKHRQLFS